MCHVTSREYSWGMTKFVRRVEGIGSKHDVSLDTSIRVLLMSVKSATFINERLQDV